MLALAAEYASSTLPTSIAEAARQLLGGAGVACATFAACKAYIHDQQPIDFTLTDPGGQTVRLQTAP